MRRLTGFGATAATTAVISLARANARRVETIGARVGVGLEPRDRLGEIGAADEEALGAPDEQRVAACLVDGAARGTHPLDGLGQFMERPGRVAGRVLDRQPRDAGLDGEPHALRHAGRIAREAAFEVGVHGQVGGGHHVPQMREGRVARDAVVRTRARPGEAGTGRGERLEAEALQIARGARVPRIGNGEAAGPCSSRKVRRWSAIEGWHVRECSLCASRRPSERTCSRLGAPRRS